MRMREITERWRKPGPEVLEQHIAVFGESGSGKTVLLSSFYGAMQAPEFTETSLFTVTADNVSQGNQLYGSYVDMRDHDRRPEPTRFSWTPYSFSVALNDKTTEGNESRNFRAMKLVWHDYPGEWFEEEVSGDDESERRAEGIGSLIRSDVALLLIDGQKLLDHAGVEERYLKSVLHNYRTGLIRLKDELLDNGTPLVRFPRIWIVALSKADLLPEMDVYAFRDLVISKAHGELDQLQTVIEGLVDQKEALSVGEDFLRLSSAKFEPNAIEVYERIGLDLIMPLASVLPFERHVRWADQKRMAGEVAAKLLAQFGPLAVTLIGKSTATDGLKGLPLKDLAKGIGRRGLATGLDPGLELGAKHLQGLNKRALNKRDFMDAILTQFGLDLDAGESRRDLLRSPR